MKQKSTTERIQGFFQKITLLVLIATFSLGSILTSCEAAKNTNKTQRGAAIGTVAGGLLGAVLGNNLGKGGNGALGAVLGGVIGGVAGGVIGNKMDKQAREIQTALPGATVERVGEGIKLTLGENSVRFDINKSTLTSTAKANFKFSVFASRKDLMVDESALKFVKSLLTDLKGKRK